MKKTALAGLLFLICFALGEKTAHAQFSIGAGYEYTQFSLTATGTDSLSTASLPNSATPQGS